ncbi:DUF1996 domain-containing protein [Dactylosporangium sp. AC04546]|uniref:DUF1996 domain-containing protein n=1 Tax=Dactylosporangium sp. AC04546 TaxID=2862460 RepID=UPI001EDDABFA|nr:DUF1996 domain-containing protein [Dactylosporangium sp. AC04546]WVK86725.1 DUF1996 domain-containing protein [Dactylosporangium sp. AC04546]
MLGAAVALALGGTGFYLATASASEAAGPAVQLEAEAFSAQSGARTEHTIDTGGGENVGWLANGDWMQYDNITLGGADLTARVAAHNPAGGSIELHLDSPTGTLLATFPVTGTGGWQQWTTVNARAAIVPAGKQTLVALMKSRQHADFVNINYFTLGTSGGAADAPATATVGAPGGGNSAPTTPSTAPSSAPSASAPTGNPRGGWVPVDGAAWQKELAAFNAVKQLPVPAGTTRVAEFHTDCSVSNEAKDDPIVLPGLPGASHMHTFFGPTVDATTTPADLFNRKTTCNAPGDNSAYWVPQLLRDGQPVKIKSFRVYYGSRLADPSVTVPFPPGLVVVHGDAKRQVPTPKGASGQFWCAGSAEVGRSADGNWPVCAPGGNMIFQLVFQDCWDGKHIDSPDHKSHMGPMQNGKCTGQYPVAVPNLSFMVNYESLGGDGLQLSSGMASSMHGDFMNAWKPENLGPLVKICLTVKAKCGTEPTFAAG